MDGAFACPECGNRVEVRGLAPGRQVRCGFCRRLLEIPYLPRADAGWKRRRFQRPKWVVWSYAALVTLAAVLGATSVWQFAKTQYRSAQDRSIKHLVESSRLHEREGRINQALIDLDAALDLAEKAGPATRARLAREREDRPLLARRDVEHELKRLRERDRSSFTVGLWLNLIARAANDADLEPLVQPIHEQFQAALAEQLAADLELARRSLALGEVARSLEACDRMAGLFKHLSPDERARIHSEAEKIVYQLVSTHGVNVTPPEGKFILGSLASYVSETVPVLVKGLEAKGYLPARESSPWRNLWKNALYTTSLEVKEQLAGSYMLSENRLTRIELHFSLTSTDQFKWDTMPTALSTVPLPRISAYVAAHAAASPERSPEFEKLLYNDARGQVNAKLANALSTMPACPRALQ
jgi:hypothetical protein